MFAGLKQQIGRTGLRVPGVAPSSEAPQRGGKSAKVVPTENRFRHFFRETKSELKKVTWPTQKQTQNLTGIVIAVSTAVGLVMGGFDLLFKQLFQFLLSAR